MRGKRYFQEGHKHTRFFPRCLHIKCGGKIEKKKVNVDENEVSFVSVCASKE